MLKFNFSVLALLILLTLVSLELVFDRMDALAQTNGIDWSEPINVSRSGSASSPKIVVDAGGNFHLFWQDEFSGIIYSTGDGKNWIQPVPGTFPFDTTLEKVEFLAGPSGLLHAVWRDSTNVLLYSAVPSESAGLQDAWSVPVQLAEDIGTLAVDIGPDGKLHLAYIKTIDDQDSPAGVYALHANPPGFFWTNPVMLDQSPYFRGLQDNLARVQISAAEDDYLFAAWDNRAIERCLPGTVHRRGSELDIPPRD